MTARSPAPWRLASSGQIVDANNRQIARIWNTRNHERDRANGELIAQAPELNRQLTVADAAITALTEALADDAVYRQRLEAALAQCVAAIDQLLPGMRHIACDVGLINTALIAARPLVKP